MKKLFGVANLFYFSTTLLFSVFLVALIFSTSVKDVCEKYFIDVPTLIKSVILYWFLCILIISIFKYWKKRWKEMILAVIAIIITLGFAEIVLRITFPYELMLHYDGLHSAKYHHRFPPNKSMYFARYDDEEIVYKTNEDGLRTEYSRKKYLSASHRIMVIGDSFVWGYGNPQKCAFPVLMEKMLKKKLGINDLAVIDAGQVSYSPMLEYYLFRDVLIKYHPQLVIQLLDATDIGDDWKYTYSSKKTKDGVRFFGPDEKDLKYYGAVFELLRKQKKYFLEPLTFPVTTIRRLSDTDNIYDPRLDWYDFHIRIGDTIEKNRFFIFRHPLSETRFAFDNSFKYVKMLHRYLQSKGIQFLFVVGPRHVHWNMKECPYNFEKNSYGDMKYKFEYFHYFEEQRSRVDFPIFSLLPAFQKTKKFPLVFSYDPHWNKEGHKLVANTLVDYLLRNGYFQKLGWVKENSVQANDK